MLGGLLAVLSTLLTYSPYVGPFARDHTGPLPAVLPIVVTQVTAGLLLAVACLALPSSVLATRSGTVGRYLSASGFVLVGLFVLPAWVLLGTPTFGPGLAVTGVGYLGSLVLALGTVLLARGLAAAGILARAGALALALALPLGGAGYWLLGRAVSADIPPPIFGPTLFLAPLGLAWVLVGYRVGRRGPSARD